MVRVVTGEVEVVSQSLLCSVATIGKVDDPNCVYMCIRVDGVLFFR